MAAIIWPNTCIALNWRFAVSCVLEPFNCAMIWSTVGNSFRYGGLKVCCVLVAAGADGAGAVGGVTLHPASLPVICDHALSIVVTTLPFCFSTVSHHWSARYGLHVVTVDVSPLA